MVYFTLKMTFLITAFKMFFFRIIDVLRFIKSALSLATHNSSNMILWTSTVQTVFRSVYNFEIDHNLRRDAHKNVQENDQTI